MIGGLSRDRAELGGIGLGSTEVPASTVSTGMAMVNAGTGLGCDTSACSSSDTILSPQIGSRGDIGGAGSGDDGESLTPDSLISMPVFLGTGVEFPGNVSVCCTTELSGSGSGLLGLGSCLVC
jgi:hypothetical protein